MRIYPILNQLPPPIAAKSLGNPDISTLPMNLRHYSIWTSLILLGIWGVYGWLVVRQKQLLENTDSMMNTGVAFGY